LIVSIPGEQTRHSFVKVGEEKEMNENEKDDEKESNE
jgi:hypothetical protein